MGADAIFFWTLETFREEAKYAIGFAGMQNNLTIPGATPLIPGEVIAINVWGFDVSTDPCLPVPYKTDYTCLFSIGTLIGASILSCVFDAYASRLRSTICSIFFPERAQQRAEYLYKRLKSGRISRRVQLSTIAWQYADTKQRKCEFWGSWIKKYCKYCCLIFCFIKMSKPLKEDSNSMCPGCGYRLSFRGNGELMQVKQKGVECKIRLCKDCSKDLRFFGFRS